MITTPRIEKMKEIRTGVVAYLEANDRSIVAEAERATKNGEPIGLSPADVVAATDDIDAGTLAVLLSDLPEGVMAAYVDLCAERDAADAHPFFGGLGGGDPVPGPGAAIHLPDGQVIRLGDFVYGSLRSALVIDPWEETGGFTFELFSYGRSQQMVGTTRPAMRTHTNIPRSGDSGLPKDWEAWIYRWNAMCSLPLDEGVMAFASRVSATFAYNLMSYRDVLLSELLLGGGELAGDPGTKQLPVHMRDNLSYKVLLEPESPQVVRDFREYLRDRSAVALDPVIMAELEMIARRYHDSEINRVMRKLKPGRECTFWVQLGGYVRRVVV